MQTVINNLEQKKKVLILVSNQEINSNKIGSNVLWYGDIGFASIKTKNKLKEKQLNIHLNIIRKYLNSQFTSGYYAISVIALLRNT